MTCRGPSTRRHRRRHQHHPRIRRAGWCIRATTTAGSRHLLTRRRCTTLRWHRGLPFWVPARRSISRTAALPRPTQTRPPSTWAAPPTSSTRRPTRTSRSSSSEHPSRAHGTHWKSLRLPATTGLLNNNRPSPTPPGGRRHFFLSVDAPVLPPPDAPPPSSTTTVQTTTMCPHSSSPVLFGLGTSLLSFSCLLPLLLCVGSVQLYVHSHCVGSCYVCKLVACSLW